MIALRKSKVQTQRDVLAGNSPAIQLNGMPARMSQAFAGSSYIQQIF
jgi:ABC-2 type transport system permease protein